MSARSAFSAPVTPPVALAYLAASLRAAGFGVTAIDALGEAIDEVRLYDEPRCRVRGLTIEQVVARVPRDTDLIGISCMFSQEWPFSKQLVQAVARAFPGVPVVLGGEHPTAVPEFILATCPEVAACAVGEGERTIVELARHFPAHPERVSGIVYRGPDGAPVRARHQDRIEDVSSIPLPAWDLLPIESYLSRSFASGTSAGRTMPLLATRGCPFKCSFCSNARMWTQRYYPRPPREVVDELEGYVRRYRAEHFEFYDLTAIVKKEWVLEFGQELERRGLKITYSLPSGTRSEALDDEVTATLARTGCRYLVYAAESGSPRILKYIHKAVKLPRMLRSMIGAKKNGLHLRCNLMIGLPKETRQDAWRTLAFQTVLALVGVDDAPIYMFSPYPGTELFDYLRKTGVVEELDEEYFKSLLCQMDLNTSSTYCENMGPRELSLYRLAGMCNFYGLSYATRPWRVLRSLRNILLTGETDTVFEQRLAERFRTKVAQEPPPPSAAALRPASDAAPVG